MRDFIPGGVLGNFQVNHSYCLHSVVLGSSQPLTEVSIKDFWEVERRPALGANNFFVLVVPNIKVMKETQNVIIHLCLHDFLWESFTLILEGKKCVNLDEICRILVFRRMGTEGIK